MSQGNYSNYTEDDIIEIAKIMTGWKSRSTGKEDDKSPYSEYVSSRHDKSTKTLSDRFDNAQIVDAAENEYKNLIDVVFKKREVALFLARNLYRWFVFYRIDDEVEANVISPMADLIIANNYEIKPALKALLSSEHFYAEERIGCMIKNPLDLIIGLFRQFKVIEKENLKLDYNKWYNIYKYSRLLQMTLFDIPNVAGWKAYYQGPGFYQIWINSVSMPYRKTLTDSVVFDAKYAREGLAIKALDFLKSLSNPFILDEIINDLSLLLFSRPLNVNQNATLKEVVLEGLPDFEWTVEYSLYIDNPSDSNLEKSIDNKVRNLLLYMMRMPEYQMS